MPIQSKNPATGEIIETYDEHTPEEVEKKLSISQAAYLDWKQASFEERARPMIRLGQILTERKQGLAELISLEMGKPIAQALPEIDKCAMLCGFYAEKAAEYLATEEIEHPTSKAYVRYDPIGIVLAVMPWNFPIWQVIRGAVPITMAGNTMVLKHASNVPQCALAIEDAFHAAGFPSGVFQSLLIGSGRVEDVIRDPRIQAATLTGSEKAGSEVARIAGSEIKKTVLELGGSDPFIVLPGVDLEKVVGSATSGRLANAGQVCVAPKRFIIAEELYDDFVQKLKEAFESQKIGDPLDESTQLGPLVNQKTRDDMLGYIEQAVEKGATLVTGGKKWGDKGAYIEPTILSDVTEGMPSYTEEVFGPVASVIKARDLEHAIEIANATDYGLGANIWTNDPEAALKEIAPKIDAGAISVNGIVRSFQGLPFGGVKRSGFGRELGREGIREFTNIKSITVNN